jgi:hypothetical protein
VTIFIKYRIYYYISCINNFYQNVQNPLFNKVFQSADNVMHNEENPRQKQFPSCTRRMRENKRHRHRDWNCSAASAKSLKSHLSLLQIECVLSWARPWWYCSWYPTYQLALCCSFFRHAPLSTAFYCPRRRRNNSVKCARFLLATFYRFRILSLSSSLSTIVEPSVRRSGSRELRILEINAACSAAQFLLPGGGSEF